MQREGLQRVLNSPETESKMLSEAPTPIKCQDWVSKDLEMHLFFFFFFLRSGLWQEFHNPKFEIFISVLRERKSAQGPK